MSRRAVLILSVALFAWGGCTADSGCSEEVPRADAGASDARDAGDVDAGPDVDRSCLTRGCEDDPGGPFCDESSGSCVGCLEASACTVDAPICRSGTCEGCQTDTQCRTAGLAETCRSDGRCVSCERDDDCAATEPFCDPLEGICVRCTLGAHCSSLAPACVEGACESCAAVESCTDDDWSRELMGRLCTASVRQSGRFAAHPLAPTMEALEAITCADSHTLPSPLAPVFAALRAGRVLLDTANLIDPDAELLTLVSPAVADGDNCFEDYECVSGECDDGATCPGTCAALAPAGSSCSFDSECRAELVCVDDTCIDPPALDEACSSFCAEGLFCSTGSCALRGAVNAPCANASQCQEGLLCDSDASVCVEFPGPGDYCSRSYMCRPGARCFKGICRESLPVGATCEGTPQCALGLRCVEEACVRVLLPGDECAASEHCALGLGCIDGRCRTLPDVGQPCFEDGGCLRGQCDLGSGTCVALPIDAACGGEHPFDVFDPCGATATCRPNGLGGAICKADGSVGALCGTFDPACEPATSTCNSASICEAICQDVP